MKRKRRDLLIEFAMVLMTLTFVVVMSIIQMGCSTFSPTETKMNSDDSYIIGECTIKCDCGGIVSESTQYGVGRQECIDAAAQAENDLPDCNCEVVK